MTFNKKLLAATLLTAGGFAAMSSANAAGTASENFNVTMTVESVCSFDASGGAVSFDSQGAATLVNEAVATSTGSIAVTCSKDAPYNIKLQSLNNSTSATGAGKMNHDTTPLDNFVEYQLYSDAQGLNIWGNNEITSLSGTGGGLSEVAKTHPVYAKMTSDTDVLLGNYVDTITASIVY